MNPSGKSASPSRRSVLGGLAGAGGLICAGAIPRLAHSQTSEPIKLGFQMHKTGIGAGYGRWYERTARAALTVLNEAGGINGREVEIIFQDDGTDPRRGAEVLDKLVSQSGCDVVFGTLFSHVVMGSAPRAAELKVPLLVCSEGHHVASGSLNRWTLQPGITDVKSQIRSVAPWITSNLGKKVAMVFPDYAFGYDHRDFLGPAIEAQGGEVVAQIAIPPTETSFTRYLPWIPRDTDVIYHVMVGPAVQTFVRELGEFFGPSDRPELFGFIDSLETVDMAGPGLEFLEGSHLWEGHPRYIQENSGAFEQFYRDAVRVDDTGASLDDSRDVSAYGHMFSVWETLFAIRDAMKACDYTGPADRQAFVEAMEAFTEMPYAMERPQGPKVFNGRTHQVFGVQYISQVNDSRLDVVHTPSIEDGLYEDEVDYTIQSF